jgi:drug/metabolite transporter (DMT)-like permease
MSARQWAQLILLSFLWGCSFIFMEMALVDMPVLTIVAGRTACAALALGGWMILSGRGLRFSVKVWRRLSISAALGIAIPFCVILWGQTMITASLSSVLNGTVPFFSLLLTHFMTHDERLKAHKVMGVLIGFMGVAVIMGADHIIHGSAAVIGQAAVLLSSLLYAWTTIYRRGFSKLGLKPLETAAGEMIAASLMLIPMALIFNQPWLLPSPGLPAAFAVLGMGLFSTALAFIIYHRLLPQVGANNMALVTFLIPVSAISMGILFLNETLSLNQVMGIALIAIGLFVIDGRLFRMLKPA